MTATLAPHPLSWHQERQEGIGGSDAPIIAGLWPYKSPTLIDLWRLKRHEIEPTEDDAAILRRGRIWEAAVAVEFGATTGFTVDFHSGTLAEVVAPPSALPTVHYDRWPVAFAHLDRTVSGKPLECKYATRNDQGWGDEDGSAEIPPHVNVQVQHQLMCTGSDRAYVAAVVGFGFHWYEVPRNDLLIRDLLADEMDFWRMKEEGEEPPPDGSDAYRSYLRDRYRRDDGTDMIPTPELLAVGNELAGVKTAKAALLTREGELEQRLQAGMGTATRLIAQGWSATWRTSKDSTTTQWQKAVADIRLAMALRNDPDLVAAVDDAVTEHREVTPGKRPFLFKTAAEEVE